MFTYQRNQHSNLTCWWLDCRCNVTRRFNMSLWYIFLTYLNDVRVLFVVTFMMIPNILD